MTLYVWLTPIKLLAILLMETKGLMSDLQDLSNDLSWVNSIEFIISTFINLNTSWNVWLDLQYSFFSIKKLVIQYWKNRTIIHSMYRVCPFKYSRFHNVECIRATAKTMKFLVTNLRIPFIFIQLGSINFLFVLKVNFHMFLSVIRV